MSDTTFAGTATPRGGAGRPPGRQRRVCGIQSRGFARTSRAFSELVRRFGKLAGLCVTTRLLRHVPWPRAACTYASMPGGGCGDRFLTCISAGRTGGSPCVLWSPLRLRRARSAYMKSAAPGSQRRWRTVFASAAAAGAGCLLLLVVIFSSALSDVPSDETRTAPSSRSWCSKRPMASPW